jgi:hypothetical protein
MNSKPEDSSNAKLTDSLKALLLGGALALASTQNSEAAAAPAKASDALDARIQKLRDQVRDTPSTNIRVGKGPAEDGSDLMWWRNAWGNGGWHNWHNGWRNGGFGWGNWHNL